MMSIYDVYEEQRVPEHLRCLKIIPDEWKCFEGISRIVKFETEIKLYFSFDDGEYPLTLSFPRLGGIRITGDKKGYFDSESFRMNYTDGENAQVCRAENGISFTVKGGKDFEIVFFRNDKPIYTVTHETISFGFKDSVPAKVSFKGKIAENERISGLGEKFNALNQVGYQSAIYNDDMGYHGHPEEWDKTRSYKNVPIFHSTNGYTLFFNSFYTAVADFSLENNSSYNIEFNNPLLDLYLWRGTPSEALDSYTALTGRPFVPPKWAFGFWAGGGGAHWCKDGNDPESVRKVFKEAVDGYERMGTIPTAFYGESEPSWDPECYKMLEKTGSRMLAWNHPGCDIPPEGYNVEIISKLFPGIEKSDIPMFRDKKTKEIMDYILFYIDYSHPKAVDLMINKYKDLWKMNLKGAMVDFGEYVTYDVLAYNGMTGEEMHNFYGHCYPKAVHEAWEKSEQKDDYILFARAAAAGTQKYACFFGGDQRAEFHQLRLAYYGGLNAALSGFTIWGSDIGGLVECDDAEIYTRWLQFAAFSPLMRTHGNHNPWNYGSETEEIFKKYFWLRENIRDYIYSMAVKSHESGAPMMYTMAAFYPDDESLRNIEDEYMFGDNLLVCPVLYAGVSSRTVTLPNGRWTYLWDGTEYSGGQTISVEAPIDVCPVFIREGSIIPVRISKDCKLFSEIEGGGAEALLVTAGSAAEARIWKDRSSSTAFKIDSCESGMTITVLDGDYSGLVLFYGETKNAFFDKEPAEILKIDSLGYSAISAPKNAKWTQLTINKS